MNSAVGGLSDGSDVGLVADEPPRASAGFLGTAKSLAHEDELEGHRLPVSRLGDVRLDSEFGLEPSDLAREQFIGDLSDRNWWLDSGPRQYLFDGCEHQPLVSRAPDHSIETNQSWINQFEQPTTGRILHLSSRAAV